MSIIITQSEVTKMLLKYWIYNDKNKQASNVWSSNHEMFGAFIWPSLSWFGWSHQT